MPPLLMLCSLMVVAAPASAGLLGGVLDTVGGLVDAATDTVDPLTDGIEPVDSLIDGVGDTVDDATARLTAPEVSARAEPDRGPRGTTIRLILEIDAGALDASIGGAVSCTVTDPRGLAAGPCREVSKPAAHVGVLGPQQFVYEFTVPARLGVYAVRFQIDETLLGLGPVPDATTSFRAIRAPSAASSGDASTPPVATDDDGPPGGTTAPADGGADPDAAGTDEALDPTAGADDTGTTLDRLNDQIAHRSSTRWIISSALGGAALLITFAALRWPLGGAA